MLVRVGLRPIHLHDGVEADIAASPPVTEAQLNIIIAILRRAEGSAAMANPTPPALLRIVT